jgi:hypothetical protein
MSEEAYLYPRLPRAVAEQIIGTIRNAAADERVALSTTVHPRAAPAPTGGTPVPEDRLARLAEVVREEFAEEMSESLTPGTEAVVDARMGQVLYSNMAIVQADAAHEGVWSFLALVLLPDVASWRFPDCHPARLLGSQRNVFRRTWWRRHILGEMMQTPNTRPLGEDELVNIFERSRMARSHELAKGLARYVLALDVADRSSFTRDLAKRVRRVMAYINVDALERSQIDILIEQAGDATKRARAIYTSS